MVVAIKWEFFYRVFKLPNLKPRNRKFETQITPQMTIRLIWMVKVNTIYLSFTTNQMCNASQFSGRPVSQLAQYKPIASLFKSQYTPMFTDLGRRDKPAIYFTTSQSCCSQNEDVTLLHSQGCTEVSNFYRRHRILYTCLTKRNIAS
jgi:hypothetical protein